MKEFMYGFICASCPFGFWWWYLRGHVYDRLLQMAKLEALSENLEKRRDAIDSGLTDITPPGAGPAGQENVLFRIRPGALQKNRRSSSDSLDSQQLSRTMDYGSQDHPIETDEG